MNPLTSGSLQTRGEGSEHNLPGELALGVYRSVLEKVRADVLIRRAVRLGGDELLVQNMRLDVSHERRIHVCGAGKAAFAMACEMEAILGDRISGGLIVTKHGHGGSTERIKLMEASHPVPDDSSVAAGQAMLSYARRVGSGELVLFLLSGGASALMEAPADGVSLRDLQSETRRLVESGADITAINAERSRLSHIKLGGLGRAFANAELVCLVLSDVIGNDLRTIGSGPFVTPNGEPMFPHVILGDSALVRELACKEAASRGLTVVTVSESVTNQARVAAAELVDRFDHEFSHSKGPVALIAAGEPVVTVHGSGLGGRCQELACAAADLIAGRESVALLAGSTDGTDGPTDVAAGLVNEHSASLAAQSGQTVEAALANSDSFHFLDSCHGLIRTGPAQSNLNDIFLMLRTVPPPRRHDQQSVKRVSKSL